MIRFHCYCWSSHGCRHCQSWVECDDIGAREDANGAGALAGVIIEAQGRATAGTRIAVGAAKYSDAAGGGLAEMDEISPISLILGTDFRIQLSSAVVFYCPSSI